MSAMTVIMPIRNQRELLATTLASLRGGIAGDDRIAVLVVDDASTDGTAEALESGLARLPGARLVRLGEQLGPAAVRNLAVDQTETEFLTFLDGDDFVSRGYFPALLESIRRLRVEMVRTDHIVVSGRERLLRRVPTSARDGRVLDPREAINPADQPTAVDHPYAWAGAYRTELRDRGLLRFPDLRTAEDRPWIWQLHLGAESFSVPEVVGLHYRRDLAGSLSKEHTSAQLDFVASMQQVVDRVLADPQGERFLPKALRRWCELTLHNLARLEDFPAPLGRTFAGLMGEGLAGAPADALAETLAGLTPERRDRLVRLMSAHAPAPQHTTTSSPTSSPTPTQQSGAAR